MYLLVYVWANIDGPLLFTCFGAHRKCSIGWAIMPWFQGSGRRLWYVNFLAWRQRIISLVCFANNAIHPWPQVMPIFTPANCLCRNFVYYLQFGESGRQIPCPKLLKYCFQLSCQLSGKVVEGLDCTASKTKAKLDPQANFPRWRPPDVHADAGREAHQKICQFLMAETCSIFLNQVC